MPGCNKSLKELYMDAMDHQMEGGRYTAKDIVAGKKTLKNGAVAGFVMVDGERKWRIVQGANSAYMKKISKKPRGSKPITKRQAVIAFNKHYKNRSPRSKSYDRMYTTGSVVSDRRYLRAPGRYDFAGVDAGPKTRKPTVKKTRTQAQINADKARMRNVRNARKGAKLQPQLSMEGGAVDLKQAVKLLRSYYDQKYN